MDTYSGHQLKISFTDPATGTETVAANAASVTARTGTGMTRVWFRVTLAAGAYTLALKNPGLTTDLTTALDDLRMVRVEDEPDWIWPVPGGTFETPSYGVDAYIVQSTDAKKASPAWGACMFNVSNTVEGWTFTQPDWFSEDANAANGKMNEPGIGLVNLAMIPWLSNGSKNWYSPAYGSARYYNNFTNPRETGEVQLLFRTNDVSAATVFTPPAGTWQLRMHLGWTARGMGGIRATARVGDGEIIDLGTVTPDASGGREMRPCQWPGAFTADGETPVALTLVSTGVTGDRWGCSVDNVCLTKRLAVAVANPGFETASAASDDLPADWAVVTPAAGNGGVQRPYLYTDVNWGSDCWEGDRRVSLRGVGAIAQTLAFPAAGAYRLTFACQKRYDSTAANPLEVRLVAPDGATNVLDTVTVKGNRFVRKQILFEVPSAGTWTLVFAGTVSGYNHTFVDGVAIESVPEGLSAPFALPKDLEIAVADGATLRLDYAGTNRVSKVRIAGRAVTGVISAATHAAVKGPGALEVVPVGTVISFR